MLLAVEGGGFFSSSASGYTSGLSLLLLGRRDHDKPMKVTPWNHYHLVNQEVETDRQLDSKKNRHSHSCSSFVCFGCAPAELEEISPSKVGFVKQPRNIPDSHSTRDRVKVTTKQSTKANERKACLKSNLKKPSRDPSTPGEGDDAHELLEEMPHETSCCTVTRKVQWTDKCGRELAEIREFEASEAGLSDDEYEGETFRRCECVIQ